MGYVAKYFKLTSIVANVVPRPMSYVYICRIWIYVSRPKTNLTFDTHRHDVMVATSSNQPPYGEFYVKCLPTRF